VDDFTRLAIRGVMKTGLSFGISDEDIPRDAKVEIAARLKEAEDEVAALIRAYEAKELEPLPGRTLANN
jgi:DNA-directed RNA polymerase subunit A'